MRITVTVVVIMFELTGALTYILPTMIVLLVTKAVGDFLGTNGIADEMIRLNGFPFLEKEEHVCNVTGRLNDLFWAGQCIINFSYSIGRDEKEPEHFNRHRYACQGYW
jgi:Voltage gated chloride channel